MGYQSYEPGKGSLRQVRVEGWVEVLRPQVACGDHSQGGMCDWQEIVAAIKERLCLTTLKLEGS